MLSNIKWIQQVGSPVNGLQAKIFSVGDSCFGSFLLQLCKWRLGKNCRETFVKFIEDFNHKTNLWCIGFNFRNPCQNGLQKFKNSTQTVPKDIGQYMGLCCL